MNIRRKFQDFFYNNFYLNHDIYGKIYLPEYNMSCPLTNEIPELYNKDGRKLELFYWRDINTAHSPYNKNQYFFIDRYNFGLDTHFYSHNDMLRTMGKPIWKYGFLNESESIKPDDYKIFDKYKGLEKDFDLIFTYSEYLLNKLPNARFINFCCNNWYGTENGGGIIDPLAYEKKNKMISILSSDLMMCDMHKYRIDIANKCKSLNLADTYGTFDGGKRVKISETLTDYRYSIVIENDIKPYWFTERLISCFSSMTVPIYCGATKIDKFFNMDGIILISPNDYDNLEKILQQCTIHDYQSRIPAIIDNFNRSKKYSCMLDTLYETYLLDRKK